MELNFQGLEIQKWEKNGTFFVFFADDSLKNEPKRSFWVLSENGMVHRFCSYHLWDIVGRNI